MKWRLSRQRRNLRNFCKRTFCDGREIGVKTNDGLPDLSGGDLSITFGHPQVAVPQLNGDHVQFRSSLAKPSREGVPTIVQANV